MIYADYNATTPVGQAAQAAVQNALQTWGNPSSAHGVGRRANELLELARRQVAEALEVSPREVVFTSGGSEANSLALLGSYWQHGPDFRLLTSPVEHSSTRDTAKLVQKLGAEIAFCALSPNGELDLAAFQAQLESFKPHLVSLMTANNETGILFPVDQIAEICRQQSIPFHTDAVQALGKMPVGAWTDADFISVSSHKVYGPKGIGALIVRGTRQLVPTHYGGSQEIKRRGGTENILGIAGFGAACANLSKPSSQLETLRNQFEDKLLSSLESLVIQGGTAKRGPNTSNIRFPGISAEILLSAFDLEGLCVSAGSACSSGSLSPSPVLLAMGLTPQEAKECVRFSWGYQTTEAEVDTAASIVINVVTRIRSRRKG